ncbi:alpha-amylase family glycosyl hydrolase [Paenibacillus larvae]
MFDFVANHISKSSEWFQRYLNDEPEYRHYFIPHDPNFDTSHVVRTRTSPLFHEYEGTRGKKTEWTTFSDGRYSFRSFSRIGNDGYSNLLRLPRRDKFKIRCGRIYGKNLEQPAFTFRKLTLSSSCGV